MTDNQIPSGAKPQAATSRFRKLSDKLYQCLVDDCSCSNKIHFGARSFCAWLLRKDSGQSEQNLPCGTDKTTDQHD